MPIANCVPSSRVLSSLLKPVVIFVFFSFSSLVCHGVLALGNVTVTTSLTGSALRTHKHVHTISDIDTSSATMAMTLKKISDQSNQASYSSDFSQCPSSFRSSFSTVRVMLMFLHGTTIEGLFLFGLGFFLFSCLLNL